MTLRSGLAVRESQLPTEGPLEVDLERKFYDLEGELEAPWSSPQAIRGEGRDD
jgi:hypothetical protein